VKLLVVDDDTFVRMLFAFDMPEVALVEACSIAEADALARLEVVDAVVVDRRLPDGDGLELIRRLRSRETTATIPMVMLTAAHDPSEEPGVLRAGADCHLAKPFSADDIRLAIKAVEAVPSEHRRSVRRSRAAELERDGASGELQAVVPAFTRPTSTQWWRRRR
jgi:DNA-binding response OmpR family regulator